MAVLVIADRDGDTVRDTTHKTVTAALKLSGEVDILVIGQGSKAAAEAAACRANGAAGSASSWA